MRTSPGSSPSSGSPRLDVAVVGAGAAGLTAAIRAAEAGARVLLLNAHPKMGLKILMSGGTRCNVTHREVEAADFRGGSRAVIARILRAFPAEPTREWFEELGVQLKLESSGKYFPVTDDAKTVLDALVLRAEALGVAIRSGARVVRLEPGYCLGIQRVTNSNAFCESAVLEQTVWPLPADSPTEWIEARKVVLATGGLSYPRTGSDGAGYAMAMALGHTLVPPVPALTPLAGADPLCRSAQGLTVEAALTLRGDERPITVCGSLLITHFGFSGPAALDLSRYWLRASPAGRSVTANFLPDDSEESLLSEWLEVLQASPRMTVRRFLAPRLPERLTDLLTAEAQVDSRTALAQLPRGSRDALFARLLTRSLVVTGTLGYEKAECTAGGVDLSEVNPSTLESRRAQGLYLCGEILDVEGRLGGFNFQWSWSSGTVAGRSAGRLVS